MEEIKDVEKTVDDKLKEGIQEYNDWWAKHRVGTRVSLLTSIVLAIIVVVFPFIQTPVEIIVAGVPHLVTPEIKYYNEILSIVLENLFWMFAVVTVGTNTLGKLADAWVKVKSNREIK